MATACLSHQLAHPALRRLNSRRPLAPQPARTCLKPRHCPSPLALPAPSRSSAVEQPSTAEDAQDGAVDMKGLVRFLYDDLPHLFDDQGIDRTMYDDRVRFRDPITAHDTVDGYLFNIRLLKALFHPDFQLHRVSQTGPYEITTRWTMVMRFILLPWKPELVFTGVSIMGVNPQTGKFCSHVDLWDSIENNDYFSWEGLQDVIKQLVILHSCASIRLLTWNLQSTK